MRGALAAAVADARARAVADGTLRLPEGTHEEALPAIEIERPARAEHGDFATNAAMRLAPLARANPMQIAERLRDAIELPHGVAEATVERPGFLNFRLDQAWVSRQVEEIVGAGEAYGRSDIGHGRRVNLEYISANPTGPLHIGNARGGFIGDVLASVLEATGHAVTREYYVNNYGTQVRDFGESVYLARTGQSGEAGYQGEYIRELAAAVPDELTGALNPLEAIGEWAWNRVYDDIRATLGRLGMRFDVYKSDRELHEAGAVTEGIERLRGGGHVYEADGATWFRSTTFGDDKDRVLVRSDGRPTYFAGDVAYLVDKFGRGFDELVYILGPDHHGTVPRWKGAAAGLGFNPDDVQFIIYGFVRLAGGQRMSKRAGTLITLDELVEEIGTDATRFFMTVRSHAQHLELDLDLAKRESSENPVYYVQYAHARCSSILRQAVERGLAPSAEVEPDVAADDWLLMLTHPTEQALIKKLMQLPDVLEDAAHRRETHEIPHYLQELAALFSQFYRDCHVLSEDAALTGARLRLVRATRQVLANTLGLLGISAPDQM